MCGTFTAALLCPSALLLSYLACYCEVCTNDESLTSNYWKSHAVILGARDTSNGVNSRSIGDLGSASIDVLLALYQARYHKQVLGVGYQTWLVNNTLIIKAPLLPLPIGS